MKRSGYESAHAIWHQGLIVVHPLRTLVGYARLLGPSPHAGVDHQKVLLVYVLGIAQDQEFWQLLKHAYESQLYQHRRSLVQSPCFLQQSYAGIAHSSGTPWRCHDLLVARQSRHDRQCECDHH